jgi:hypothetical protein
LRLGAFFESGGKSPALSVQIKGRTLALDYTTALYCIMGDLLKAVLI